MGQHIVLLLLLTTKITIPVGFKFYFHDPVKKKWLQNDKALRQQNAPKAQRPEPPKNNPAFPTKIELALQLLAEFKKHFSKRYEGFGHLALQQGVDGSCRGVILSMLVDLCLLYHPDQVAKIENKMPASTLGSRKDQLKNEALLQCFNDVLMSPSPMEAFSKIKDTMSDLLKLR